MSLDFAAIAQAVRVWVKLALDEYDLADDRVILANQSGSRPKLDKDSGPFVTIDVRGPTILGAVDSLSYSYSNTAPAGKEITVSSGGSRELAVSIQVFTYETTGNDQARSLAAKIQDYARQHAVADAFDVAGLTLFDVGQVNGIYQLLRTEFEGRAGIEARFYAQSYATSRTGYIAGVEVTDTDRSTTFEVEE